MTCLWYYLQARYPVRNAPQEVSALTGVPLSNVRPAITLWRGLVSVKLALLDSTAQRMVSRSVNNTVILYCWFIFIYMWFHRFMNITYFYNFTLTIIFHYLCRMKFWYISPKYQCNAPLYSVGASSCSSCPEGSSCSGNGTSSPSACAAGYVAPAESSSCTLCATSTLYHWRGLVTITGEFLLSGKL